MNRRQFLAAATMFAASAGIPNALAAQKSIYVPGEIKDFWQAPREIWVARNNVDERICYWKDGALDVEGYIKACHFLKDVQTGDVVQMDVGLLNLLRAIQGWLVYYNINAPIVIKSAYRSPLTNSKTEGAAKNSLHMQGRAVDIMITGIPSEYLFKLSAAFSGGGVGFYPGKTFTHVDTGRIRYWMG